MQVRDPERRSGQVGMAAGTRARSATAVACIGWLAARAIVVASLGSLTCGAQGLPEIIARIKPSIVAVGSTEPIRGFSFAGTGFVVGDGTLIVTNRHVVPPILDPTKREALAIAIPNGTATPEIREATPVAMDNQHDLALLRIRGGALAALPLAASGRVREGDSVAFTGFPIGTLLGLIPATHRGTVAAITPIFVPRTSSAQLDPRALSQLRSEPFSVLQLDGTAYPGNSGSPVYDSSTGQIVGIVNMVFVKGTKESGITNPSGITYAIPVEHLVALLRDVPGR